MIIEGPPEGFILRGYLYPSRQVEESKVDTTSDAHSRTREFLAFLDRSRDENFPPVKLVSAVSARFSKYPSRPRDLRVPHNLRHLLARDYRSASASNVSLLQ